MESDIAFHGGLSVFQGAVIMRSLSRLAMVALACVHLTEGASEPGPVERGSLTEWRACLAESGRLYEEGRFNEAERVLSKRFTTRNSFPLSTIAFQRRYTRLASSTKSSVNTRKPRLTTYVRSTSGRELARRNTTRCRGPSII
jgi:hypothetical protein